MFCGQINLNSIKLTKLNHFLSYVTTVHCESPSRSYQYNCAIPQVYTTLESLLSLHCIPNLEDFVNKLYLPIK